MSTPDAATATRRRTAAGCLILARRTGRFLFCFRSRNVPSGGTWSLWGGKPEGDESPIQTALREVQEETGFASPTQPSHIHRLSNRSFTYDTFLMVVEDEFSPITGKEADGYAWLPIEDVPTPIHWGLEKLLEDQTAVSRLVKAVENTSGRTCSLRARKATSGQKRNAGSDRPWRQGPPGGRNRTDRRDGSPKP